MPSIGRNSSYEEGLSFVWVANPYLQTNIEELNSIVSQVDANFNSVHLRKHDIGNMARWYYLSSDPYIWSQSKFDIIAFINKKIMKMSLYPLTISAIINKLMLFKAQRIRNVMEIIIRWLYVSRGYEVSSVDIVYEQNPTMLLIDTTNQKLPEEERLQYIDYDTIILKLIPRLKNGASIYLESEDMAHLLRNFDLNSLLDYEYLSDDEIAEYLLKDDPHFKTYKKWNDLYLIPFDDPNNIIRRDFMKMIQIKIQGLRQQQMYVIPKHSRKFLKIHQSLSALPELAYMWQQQILDVNESDIIGNPSYYMRSNINFGQSAEDFMQESLTMLERGKLPRFIVQGATSWQRVFTEYTKYNTLKLYYAAVRAMAKVIAENDLPLMVLDNLLVMPDYSVEVMLANYDQVKHFKRELELLLHAGSHNSTDKAKQIINGWTVYSVADIGRAGLRMVALHRYYWQLQDSKLTSLALQINDDNIVYLVVDTYTSNYKKPTADDVLELVDDLEAELQNYYSICEISQNLRGFFDATKATLDELLLLVPMNRDTNNNGIIGKQYCLSEDLLSELIAATSTAATQAAMDEDVFRMFVDNPAISSSSSELTAVPLSQSEILRGISRALGLRGFFTVGKLNGLLSAMPDYTLLHVKPGEVNISETGDVRVQNGINYKLYEIELTLYSDDTLYEESKAMRDIGYIVPMFQLYLKKNDVAMMIELINSLWHNGWFLNHWGKQLYRHTGKITRYMYVRDVRLNYGIDGITESNKVISLLKRVHSHYI